MEKESGGKAKIVVLGFREEWLAWWGRLGPVRRWGPVAGAAGYAVLMWTFGFLRADHWVLGAFLVALSWGGPRVAPFLRFALPVFCIGYVYDSQRIYEDSIRGAIHVAEPYLFDLRFFGIPHAGKILTPNEWFQHHLSPGLDLMAGFFYLTFVGLYLVVTAYWYFVASRSGTAGKSSAEMLATRDKYGWTLFWLNVVGYSTYYWYPAAPPWYVAEYGLGPARLDVRPNAAGCLRFDELLGTQFFTGMYGRSADVFGAIPSLHVAYPFLAFLLALELKSLRLVCLVFYLAMCFSASYLNHHYVLDMLWGTAYAVAVKAAVDAWYRRRASFRLAL